MQIENLKNLSRNLISILIVCIFGHLLQTQANATKLSVMQSPQVIQVVVRPDIKITLPFTLTNLGDPNIMFLKVYALSIKDSRGTFDLKPYEERDLGKIRFLLNNSQAKLSEPFFVKTGVAMGYKVAVDIPTQTKEKDYYFALVAQSEKNPGNLDTSNLSIQGGIGSIIMLTVKSDGAIDQKGHIVQFAASSNHSFTFNKKLYHILDSFSLVPLTVIVANTGENVFMTKGLISIRPRIFNSNTQIIQIKPTYVLAESSKILHNVDFSNIKTPFIGIFQAQAILNMGGSRESKIAYANYIVLPITYFKYGFVTLFLIISIWIYYRQSRGN